MSKLESMGCNLRATSHLLRVGVFAAESVIGRNGDRLTGELSLGNEVPNRSVEKSRWLEPLHQNILQLG